MAGQPPCPVGARTRCGPACLPTLFQSEGLYAFFSMHFSQWLLHPAVLAANMWSQPGTAGCSSFPWYCAGLLLVFFGFFQLSLPLANLPEQVLVVHDLQAPCDGMRVDGVVIASSIIICAQVCHIWLSQHLHACVCEAAIICGNRAAAEEHRSFLKISFGRGFFHHITHTHYSLTCTRHTRSTTSGVMMMVCHQLGIVACLFSQYPPREQGCCA